MDDLCFPIISSEVHLPAVTAVTYIGRRGKMQKHESLEHGPYVIPCEVWLGHEICVYTQIYKMEYRAPLHIKTQQQQPSDTICKGSCLIEHLDGRYS